MKKWRRMLHLWDLPEEGADNEAAPSNEPESKNGALQRQVRGLPLKIPSAIRPAVKRSRSFLDALISPTAAPPEPKQHKTGAGPAAHPSDAHPSNVLMAKWRQMATTEPLQNDVNMVTESMAIEAEIEEVSYSEDEDVDEVGAMEVEPVHILA